MSIQSRIGKVFGTILIRQTSSQALIASSSPSVGLDNSLFPRTTLAIHAVSLVFAVWTLLLNSFSRRPTPFLSHSLKSLFSHINSFALSRPFSASFSLCYGFCVSLSCFLLLYILKCTFIICRDSFLVSYVDYSTCRSHYKLSSYPCYLPAAQPLCVGCAQSHARQCSSDRH